MCLQILNQRLRGNSTTTLTGYKLFRTTESIYDDGYPGPYRFRYFNHNKTAKVPLNRWIKSGVKTLFASCIDRYKGGFHIYTEETFPKQMAAGVPGFVVVKVLYRGVLARGREEGALYDKVPVVVAREMYVPHKEKK